MEYNLKRSDGESIEQYHFRISKLKDNALVEMTWDEIAQLVNEENGTNYDTSKWRKDYQIAKRYHELVYVNEYDGLDDYKKELEELQDELYKTKVRTRDSIREKRKILRDEARWEEIVDNMYSAISELEPLKFEKNSMPRGKGKGILIISDWHIGMVVDNYWNKFNLDIAKDRVNKLLEDTVEYCEMLGVSELYVVNLNDNISGGIHATTRVQEEIDSVQQAMKAAEWIANLLNELNNHGYEINYVSTTDNHSRRMPNWRESIEGESFVKIIDWYIKSRLDHTDINFIESEIDESIAYFKINGKNVFAVHGHRDKPNKAVHDMAMASRLVPDLILMGHYHSKHVIPDAHSKVIVNGSLVGVDEYAKDNRYFGTPSQTFIVLDGENFIDIDICF